MKSTRAVEVSSQAVSPLLMVEPSAAWAEVVARASAASTAMECRAAPLPVRFSRDGVMVGW